MAGRKPTQKSPETTREALLAAARDVFFENGFSGARVDDIAARAGVNKALINYHFGSKRKLFQAIIDAFSQAFIARMDAMVLPDDPPLTRLRMFVRAVGGLMTDFPQLPRLLLLEASRHFQEEGAKPPPHGPMAIHLLGDIMAKGAAEGSLRALNPFFTFLHIVSSIAFFQVITPAMQHMGDKLPIPPDGLSRPAFLTFLEDQIIAGVAHHPIMEH